MIRMYKLAGKATALTASEPLTLYYNRKLIVGVKTREDLRFSEAAMPPPLDRSPCQTSDSPRSVGTSTLDCPSRRTVGRTRYTNILERRSSSDLTCSLGYRAPGEKSWENPVQGKPIWEAPYYNPFPDLVRHSSWY